MTGRGEDEGWVHLIPSTESRARQAVDEASSAALAATSVCQSRVTRRPPERVTAGQRLPAQMS